MAHHVTTPYGLLSTVLSPGPCCNQSPWWHFFNLLDDILFIWGPHPVQMAQFHLRSICWRHDLEIAWTGWTDKSIKESWIIHLWQSLKQSNCLRCLVHLDQRLALADWQIGWLALSLLSLEHWFWYSLQTGPIKLYETNNWNQFRFKTSSVSCIKHIFLTYSYRVQSSQEPKTSNRGLRNMTFQT